MDEQKIKRIFSGASKSFISVNCEPSSPIIESAVQHVALAKKKGKARHPKRCILRYLSLRCRLLDVDNGTPKFFTDALRYCGAILGDTEEDIEYSYSQEKVATKKEECTIIEIIYP